MRKVEHAVEIRVHGLAAPGKLDQRGLLAAISLLSLKSGDPVPHCLGTVGRTALDNLSVEGREFAVVEADGDLRAHHGSISHRVNQLVCAIVGWAW
jgi:hypothetical protein